MMVRLPEAVASAAGCMLSASFRPLTPDSGGKSGATASSSERMSWTKDANRFDISVVRGLSCSPAGRLVRVARQCRGW